MRPRGLSAGQASEALSKLMLEFPLCRARDVRLGDEDEVIVRSRTRRPAPKGFPQAAFGGVPHDGAADLLPHGQTETIMAVVVAVRDHEEEPPVDPQPFAKHDPEVRGGCQSIASWEVRSRAAGHRDGLTPRVAFGPSAAAASAPGDPPWSACGPKNRGYDVASGYSVGTSASWLALPMQDKALSLGTRAPFCQFRADQRPFGCLVSTGSRMVVYGRQGDDIST